MEIDFPQIAHVWSDKGDGFWNQNTCMQTWRMSNPKRCMVENGVEVLKWYMVLATGSKGIQRV